MERDFPHHDHGCELPRQRRQNPAQPRLARRLLNLKSTEEDYMQKSLTTMENVKGRVAVPILLWMAGVPFTLVFLLWLFFFRGH